MHTSKCSKWNDKFWENTESASSLRTTIDFDFSSFHFIAVENRGQKTHLSATTSVLMAIILRWMCRCNARRWWCWRWYGNRCTATLFHSNWCPCSHIIGESTPRMPYNRYPIDHRVELLLAHCLTMVFFEGLSERTGNSAQVCARPHENTITLKKIRLQLIHERMNDLLLLMMLNTVEFLLVPVTQCLFYNFVFLVMFSLNTLHYSLK